jgi:hypothetical protein
MSRLPKLTSRVDRAIIGSPVRPLGCQPILLPGFVPLLLLEVIPDDWPLGWSVLGVLALSFIWFSFLGWRAYVIADTPRREARRARDDRPS